MTVDSPPNADQFIELDHGTRVAAQLWDRPISASGRPAVVVPDSIHPTYLARTEDADSGDADMLWKSAEYGQDPIAFFYYVRGMAFDPYLGSLRGTRGTLWGEAGNAVDKSSLLIAALRASGTPARYRHGSLGMGAAQTLLESMFTYRPGLAGYLPSGTITADPVKIIPNSLLWSKITGG